MRVGNLLFRIVRFAERCKEITYDYDKGTRNLKDLEPLATLIRTRLYPNKGT